MGKSQCGRCERPTTFTTPVEVGLDGTHVRLELCERCARNCRADVGLWLMFGTTSAVRRAPIDERNRPRTALPTRELIQSPRENRHVPFPIIRRNGETTRDDGQQQLLLAPEILHGKPREDVARATARWTWAKGCRARVLSRDIEPVDVLLAADTDHPDDVIPGDVPAVEMRIARGLRVVVAPETSLILDAYTDQ
jgi:hypothetical protein